MTEVTHHQAVTALRSSPNKCILRVSREVLVILPDGHGEEEEAGDEGVENDESSSAVTPIVAAEVPPSTTPPHKPLEEAVLTFSSEPPRYNVRVTDVASNQEVESSAENISDDKRALSTEGEAVLLDSDDDALATTQDDTQQQQEVEELGKEAVVSQVLEEVLERTMSESARAVKGTTSESAYVNMEVAQSIIEAARAEEAGQEDSLSEVPEREECGSRLDSGLMDTPNYPEETVVLSLNVDNLGMSIVGGVDHISRVFGCGQPGIYISKITPGGAASKTGKLFMGDRIIQVNGRDMQLLTHEEAVEWLVTQDSDLQITVRHEPQPPDLKEIIFEKALDEKLGISIKGGSSDSFGNPYDHDDDGIFISKITKGGAAERCGELKVGHRILEVGQMSLLGADHVEAVHELRRIGTTVRLLVCQGYSPRSESIKDPAIIELRSQRNKSGSADMLDMLSPLKEATVKRTRSLAMRGDSAQHEIDDKELDSDLQKVIQELTRFRDQVNILFAEEEKREREEGEREKSPLDQEKVVNQLDQSVNEMVLQAASPDNMPTTDFLDKRKSSVEIINKIQQEKRQELDCFISGELLHDLSMKVNQTSQQTTNNEDQITNHINSSDTETATMQHDTTTRVPIKEPQLEAIHLQEEEHPNEETFQLKEAEHPSQELKDDEYVNKEIIQSIEKEHPKEENFQLKEAEHSSEQSKDDKYVNEETVQSIEEEHLNKEPPTNLTYQSELSSEGAYMSPDDEVRMLQESRRLHSSVSVVTLRPSEDIPERPRSAGDRPVYDPSTKPANLVAPEKLLFKDRVALYQRKLNSSNDTAIKNLNRRSWAPGTQKPDGGVAFGVMADDRHRREEERLINKIWGRKQTNETDSTYRAQSSPPSFFDQENSPRNNLQSSQSPPITSPEERPTSILSDPPLTASTSSCSRGEPDDPGFSSADESLNERLDTNLQREEKRKHIEKEVQRVHTLLSESPVPPDLNK